MRQQLHLYDYEPHDDEDISYTTSGLGRGAKGAAKGFLGAAAGVAGSSATKKSWIRGMGSGAFKLGGQAGGFMKRRGRATAKWIADNPRKAAAATGLTAATIAILANEEVVDQLKGACRNCCNKPADTLDAHASCQISQRPPDRGIPEELRDEMPNCKLNNDNKDCVNYCNVRCDNAVDSILDKVNKAGNIASDGVDTALNIASFAADPASALMSILPIIGAIVICGFMIIMMMMMSKS